jgi:hypothetical protein
MAGWPMDHVFTQEMQTYAAQLDRLLAEDEGKFVLIKADQVLGTFETAQEAIREGYRQLGRVPFLVRQILRGEDGTVETDPDQAWFWSPEWQAREQQADDDLRLGRYEDFDNMDDFLNSL